MNPSAEKVGKLTQLIDERQLPNIDTCFDGVFAHCTRAFRSICSLHACLYSADGCVVRMRGTLLDVSSVPALVILIQFGSY